MRIGVCLPNFPFGVEPSAAAVVEVAHEAERLGLDSLWATDHLLPPRAMTRYGNVLEALATLAFVGGATSRIELGTSVLVLPLRHAVTVAKQAASIDALSGGRLLLGVGAGWMEGEFANLGADFHRRGSDLDEALAVLRTLWTAPEPRHAGERWRFAGVAFAPRPARPGGIPIWVGGNSSAAVARAARLGDAWHPEGRGAAELAEPVRLLNKLTPPGREVAVTLRRAVDLRPGAEAASGPNAAGEIPLRGLDALHAELDALAALGVEHVVCQLEHRSLQELLPQLERLAAAAGIDG
jgi:probable F420-dependent oxidoreductase